MMKKIDKRLLQLMLVGSLFGLPLELYAEEVKDCTSNAKIINSLAEPHHDTIQQAAKRYDVSPALITSVIAARSCFDQAKISPEGAVGLMQLMPTTAKSFGATDVFSPPTNIDAGTRYLSYLLKRYQGSVPQVLAAYAADEGWQWQDDTISVPFHGIRKPVSQVLSALLALENNKKANQQALALLAKWGKSEKSFRMALLALPESDEKSAQTWFKSRLARVHYPRTPEARGCGGFSVKTLGNKAAPYEDIIQKAAKRHGVNPALVKSVIAAESCYREMVVSYKGASGLMQLMPGTAEELGVLDIFDPQENINAGTRYLSWLLRHYNGSVTHAIAAYNAGAARIRQGEPVTISFAETRGYIRTVLTHLTRLEKGKQSIADANLLLAGWEQADLEYQAALRGETLVSVPQPPAELALDAFQRNEKAPLMPVEVAMQPRVQLISAIDAGIVRVKHTSMTEVMPAEPMPVEAQLPMNDGLPNCQDLPQALLALAEQQGSGRYGAFFYFPPEGETLGLIATKLGVNVQDIARLSNIPPDVAPMPGDRLKVAECVRAVP